MAKSNIKEWSVKVTCLPSNISNVDLAKHLNIATHRVSIPKKQTDPNKWYAWINGFQNEQNTKEFINQWNETIIYEKKIKCKIHESILTIPSTFSSQYDNNITTSSVAFESTNNSQATSEFSLSSPESLIESKSQECYLGSNCTHLYCLCKHPSDWNTCENGIECVSFDCKANHPVSRINKCALGDTCENNECTYIHPPGRSIKCKDGILCDDFNCNRLHPRDWDPPEDTTRKYFSSQNSNAHCNLKSFRERMIERESVQLPIFNSRVEFCQRLKREKLLVVTAETGSGKSTQLPQYAAEYFSGGLIVCTQPRVIAAMSLARRVADEYDGTSEGNSVGYQVGSGNRVHGTNIMFMTDSALIHESQFDENLSKIRVLIIDEAHERSLNTDIVIGISKLLLEKRQNDFFVVIASATIDPTRFLTFFDRASNIPLTIPGRIFPVTEEYSPASKECTDQNLIELHVIPTILRLFPKHTGHTLVFLHGQHEIEHALKLFSRNIPNGCIAFPLYGSLSPEEQDKVLKFDDEHPKSRMVVFCTNVAETSLTIKNTRLVIDSGFAKEARFDVQRRITIIETVRISKSSANQRKGRAGRTAPGHCVRLYSINDLKRENIEPEILRSSLDLVVLQLVRLGLDPRTFPFMDSPDTHVLTSSLELLIRLSCVIDETTSTIRGQLFTELSLDPRLSALMTNMYTDVGGESSLALTSIIVAILSAPGSLFYMGGNSKEAKAEARNRVAVGASEYESDLFYLCNVFKNWKNTGLVNLKDNRCMNCQKMISKRFDSCRSCRTQHANIHGLNNKVLQIIYRSSEFYMKTIMNPRWKLIPSNHAVLSSDERDAIGEQLYKLFPEQLGHLLVYHLPDEGIRLINNEIRARITDTSVYVQRVHDHGYEHFVTMSITQLPSGDHIIDRLHPIPSRFLPPIPIRKLFCLKNVGWMIHNEMRKTLDNRRSEPWAKWFVYEYDRRTCCIILWGMESDKLIIETIVRSIFDVAKSKLAAITNSIEFGPVRASFKSGLICSNIETMDNTLRLNLHHVPCKNFNELKKWLQTNLDINFYHIKENNFRLRTTNDNQDERYEAPPFYIIFKSAEVFRKVKNRIPNQFICSEDMVLSSSTMSTRMDEKDTWGRQLVITINRFYESKTCEQILERLTPYIIDCRERGKKSRPLQPALRVANLPININESTIRQALQRVNPEKITLYKSSTDGTGSSTANIFFHNEQQRDQARAILQIALCDQPIQITIRKKRNGLLTEKWVRPTVTDLLRKESPTQTFIITAINREVALKLYNEIIPNLQPSWKIDSSSTVIVLQSDLYPNFDKLVQNIAHRFNTHVEQELFRQKHQNSDNNHDKRCIFSQASPSKTALAASMLAQATSHITIRITSERQKRLFRELFDENLIETWCQRLKLKLTEKNGVNTLLEIRGPQIQQGQLMREIADYSDKFDERFRVHDLSTTMGNLFNRQKTASIKLDEIAEKWSKKGCDVLYIRKTNSLIIHAQPKTTQSDIQICETEVKQLLTELAASNDASEDRRKCVFCQQMSASTRVFRICGHAYCLCVSSTLSQMFPLQCYESTCKTNIHIQDLQEIYTDQRELSRICKRSLQIYLKEHANTDDRLFCPNGDCDGLLKSSDGYRMCLSCGHDVCVLCRVIDDDLHERRTCDERRKMHSEMCEFLPRLYEAAEKYAKNNWPSELPRIIQIDHNLPLIDQCLSLKRFYKAVQSTGNHPPPDISSGFFAFHGTASQSTRPICIDGFDPKRRRGQVHGPGEYFGITAAVSDGYCREKNSDGIKTMIVAFILRCDQLRTIDGFCHVVNNPIDWSIAYNLPVLIISYGDKLNAPFIFGKYQPPMIPDTDRIHSNFFTTNIFNSTAYVPITNIIRPNATQLITDTNEVSISTIRANTSTPVTNTSRLSTYTIRSSTTSVDTNTNGSVANRSSAESTSTDASSKTSKKSSGGCTIS